MIARGATAIWMAISICASLAPARAAQTVERAIDAAQSKAAFSVRHVFVERVTGTLAIESGSVTLTANSPIPVAVTAVLDPATIKTEESDRDSALRSADWFDVAKYPQWTFASTKITGVGNAGFTMDGLLTIHGVTQPEELHVTIGGTADRPTYHAVGSVDRHAFGMKIVPLDPAIGNPVEVTLDVVLKP